MTRAVRYMVFYNPKDVHVDSTSATSNFGTTDYLEVGRSGPLAQTKRAFIQWPSLPAIPFSLTKATLGIFRENVFNTPSARDDIEVHRVTAGWGETTVTWNNQPGVLAGARATISIPDLTTKKWYTITNANLLTDVLGWLDGSIPNNGWRLKVVDETQINDSRQDFRSTDYSSGILSAFLLIEGELPPEYLVSSKDPVG